jgi:hypothetical protein
VSVNETDFGQQYREAETAKSERPITHEEHVAGGSHKMGEALPFADIATPCISGKSSVGQSTYAAASDHTHSIGTNFSNGAPTDAILEDPNQGFGCMVLDYTNHRLYIRDFDRWRYVALL